MVAAAIITPSPSDAQKDGDNGAGAEGVALVTTRPPKDVDAASVSQLVREAGTLEPNTTYAYLLLCSHFSETSAIAEVNGKIVGCVLGYRIPERPRTLFVWQIGVHESARRKGVGRKLLDELLDRPALADVEHLETTIAPSNTASKRLFERWASRHGIAVNLSGAFDSSLFGPKGNHEREDILKIGPLRRQA